PRSLGIPVANGDALLKLKEQRGFASESLGKLSKIERSVGGEQHAFVAFSDEIPSSSRPGVAAALHTAFIDGSPLAMQGQRRSTAHRQHAKVSFMCGRA